MTALYVYADPPYVGQARRHYSADPRCAEVDHAALIERLCSPFVAGWALSLSSPSLQAIMPLCPAGVRVGAWVKPFASFKPGVNPGYCWEPLIWFGGRGSRARSESTVRDFVVENITLRRGLSGAKPEAFSRWLFDLWGVVAGDQFVDVFPGSGAVTAAWNRRQRELELGQQLALVHS